MVKAHGIEYCQDCRKIFLIIISRKTMTIRFNALLKLCKKNIDLKYSAPRLQRHLKGLEGKWINRTKISSQEVYYSPILPKTLDLATISFEQEIEKLSKLPIAKLVKMKMYLYRLMGLEQNISDIESLLNRQTPQEHHARFLYLETITKQTLAKIDKAMINRSYFEYIEVLKNLKNEKARLLKI
jgi:hypothetical protein